MALLAALLIDREAKLTRALADAETDPLTGMANRRGLARAWQRLAGDPGVSLMFLDLVGFKAVNDRLGHAAGDALLRDVACRLRRALPAPWPLARVGGDEFVALAPTPLAGALIASLAAPFPVANGPPVTVGVKIGTADPGHADLASALAEAEGRMEPQA
ncbi:GGDEF domain-containing protein [Thermaurantiacus sp.]